jgi:hypothetical protein
MQLSGCPNTFPGADEVDDHCGMSCHVMLCYHLSPTVTPQFGWSIFVSTLLHSHVTPRSYVWQQCTLVSSYSAEMIASSWKTFKYYLFSNGSQKQ